MKSLYFIGIKGVGMSALALVAKGMGYHVRGSDVAEVFITDASLRAADIEVFHGFSADHLMPNPDTVVVGAAYGEDNPEVAAAVAAQLKLTSYSECLAALASQQKTLAVAGTHGKTTTTALLSFLLYKAAWQPSFVIGTGEVTGLPAHGYAGRGDYFVAEADDYKRSPTDRRPKFLDLNPYAAIITSIEHDHPDIYPSLADCAEAFYEFACRVAAAGFLVINADDPELQKLKGRLPGHRFIGYGFASGADYQILLEEHGFRLQDASQSYGPFRLALPGRHNLANAAAAVVMALTLGMAEALIVKIIPDFQTVQRRYQLIGQFGQVPEIDDYAHHPTSVRRTLETARAQYPNRPIWCLFQPHTYSRTAALLQEFGTAFGAADTVIVTDIFASAREQSATISAPTLVSEIGRHHPHVHYVAKTALLTYLRDHLPPRAVLLTLGAGDIYKTGLDLVGR